MSKTQPARGMRDFLPADVRKRNYVINIIKEVYESYGFEPLETPAVENLETLTGKYGEEGNQLIFKILKRGEKLDANDKELADLALRYDLTVPLARVVANYKNELPKFFKRYQIQPVWRADRPARGRFREFYQCDVDAIGSSSMIVEAELCSAVSEILTRLGFEDFVIRVNHREILRGILNLAGVLPEKHTDALVVLDKIDKIGREGVERELKQRGIADESEIKLLSAFEYFIKQTSSGTFDKAQKIEILKIQKELKFRADLIESRLSNAKNRLEEKRKSSSKVRLDLLSVVDGAPYLRIASEIYSLKKILAESDSASKALADLTTLISFLTSNKIEYEDETLSPIFPIKIDPTLARGLSYYTGAIFEIVLTDGDFAGSIGGGGRYDGLIGMFGKEQIPACGFSLGLERILVVMNERGMFPAELDANAADVVVTVWNKDSVGESLKLAGELRKGGLRVLVYPEADKLGKQFKYAAQVNAAFVCVVGET
ncbi:MAG TPA: histidine--tRNA ligase, partial [Pyrinomonadaceae bacterium]|nr:histidine--tRNA ligase [Pyrinomonadaceae bacterium]